MPRRRAVRQNQQNRDYRSKRYRSVRGPLPITIENYVPYLINSLAIKLRKPAEPHFIGFDLTIPKWRILLAVYKHESVRFRELATLTSIEPPTLSRLLNEMEDDRLCQRQKEDLDNRSVLIFLTAAGRKLFERTISWAIAVEKELLDGIDEADIAALRRALTRMSANLDEAGEQTG